MKIKKTENYYAKILALNGKTNTNTAPQFWQINLRVYFKNFSLTNDASLHLLQVTTKEYQPQSAEIKAYYLNEAFKEVFNIYGFATQEESFNT